MDNQYSCLPNRQSITGVADRSIFAPSLCGEGRGEAARKARGDPQGLFYSRGDPPPESNARGDPPWIYASRGDPPDLIRARGHPPEPYLARGRPPNAQKIRNSSFKQGLIFRILGSQKWPHERGVGITD